MHGAYPLMPVPCWRAVEPERLRRNSGAPSVSGPSDGYLCGNAPCLKLLDPAEEYAALRPSASETAVHVGASMLGLGLVCWCTCCCLDARHEANFRRKQDRRRAAAAKRKKDAKEAARESAREAARLARADGSRHSSSWVLRNGIRRYSFKSSSSKVLMPLGHEWNVGGDSSRDSSGDGSHRGNKRSGTTCAHPRIPSSGTSEAVRKRAPAELETVVETPSLGRWSSAALPDVEASPVTTAAAMSTAAPDSSEPPSLPLLARPQIQPREGHDAPSSPAPVSAELSSRESRPKQVYTQPGSRPERPESPDYTA